MNCMFPRRARCTHNSQVLRLVPPAAIACDRGKYVVHCLRTFLEASARCFTGDTCNLFGASMAMTTSVPNAVRTRVRGPDRRRSIRLRCGRLSSAMSISLTLWMALILLPVCEGWAISGSSLLSGLGHLFRERRTGLPATKEQQSAEQEVRVRAQRVSPYIPGLVTFEKHFDLFR